MTNYEAIGLHDSQLATAHVARKLGRQEGEVMLTVLPPIEDAPEGVTIKYSMRYLIIPIQIYALHLGHMSLIHK